METKNWSEPKLIELVRGAPEESVLVACRLSTPGTPVSPRTVGTGCICPPQTICTSCHTLTGS